MLSYWMRTISEGSEIIDLIRYAIVMYAYDWSCIGPTVGFCMLRNLCFSQSSSNLWQSIISNSILFNSYGLGRDTHIFLCWACSLGIKSRRTTKSRDWTTSFARYKLAKYCPKSYLFYSGHELLNHNQRLQTSKKNLEDNLHLSAVVKEWRIFIDW